jgi:hypothetical protein
VAIYSTFFVCRPRELARGFPGWKPPLPKPVKREVKNPFTGKSMTVESREPQWPEDEGADGWGRVPTVVAVTGDYEDYLEDRVPRFVRDQPHWCAKGLTQIELNPLGQALEVESAVETALYGPPSAGASLDRVRPELVAALQALDKKAMKAVAKQWAATMSSREHTHSVTGHRISDGWRVGDALEVLGPLAELATEADDGDGMYLLVEC